MKKLFITLVVIMAVAASCNKNNPPVTPPSPPPAQTPPPTPPVSPTTQKYSNATYGFSFDYPVTAQFVTPSYPDLQDKIVQVQIGKDQYPNTNFGDAAFSVSAGAAKDLAACLKLSPPENGDGFKTKVTINGTDFYMTKSSGVGAGNLYESNIYRTVRSTGGACIELNETIHTSNIANYPAGTVTEVNKADVQTKLDTILNSFKFTQ
jgi:hypothetical protein